MVVIIVGIIAAVAIPQLDDIIEKSRGAEAIANLDIIRKGIVLYQLDNSGANPANLAAIDILINNSSDWTFSATGVTGTATKARAPYSGNTFTMDVNGTLGGSWPFVPSA